LARTHEAEAKLRKAERERDNLIAKHSKTPAQSERWIQGKRGLQRETYETPQDPAQSTENEARDAEQFLRERDEQAAYITHLEESIKVKDGALSIAAEENRRLTVALSDTEAKYNKVELLADKLARENSDLQRSVQAAEARLRAEQDHVADWTARAIVAEQERDAALDRAEAAEASVRGLIEASVEREAKLREYEETVAISSS
jgi:hypothetical protein